MFIVYSPPLGAKNLTPGKLMAIKTEKRFEEKSKTLRINEGLITSERNF